MNALTEKVSLSKEVDMENFWMPFTANKQFKAAPRILKSAKGMYFTTIDDKKSSMRVPVCGASTQDTVAKKLSKPFTSK